MDKFYLAFYSAVIFNLYDYRSHVIRQTIVPIWYFGVILMNYFAFSFSCGIFLIYTAESRQTTDTGRVWHSKFIDANMGPFQSKHISVLSIFSLYSLDKEDYRYCTFISIINSSVFLQYGL